MANQSAVEQAILELVNRARLDPAAEAARYGIALNEGVPSDETISTAMKQPLAMNDTLLSVARAHSQDMIDNDYFAHDDLGGHDPFERMTAAGYSFDRAGENIAFRSTSGVLTPAMTLQLHEDLFVDAGIDGRGHRVNLMNPDFQEVGVGQAQGLYEGLNATMLTEDFGRPGANRQFLTGVAFNDTVTADQFYSIGEGRAGITVSVSGGPSTVGGSAGGYSEEVTAGLKTITFSGGDQVTPVVLTATIAAGFNAKIDLMGQSTIRTSVSVTAVNGISTIFGLGTNALTLTGTDGTQAIHGSSGGDLLDGKAGADTMSGGIGNDTYYVDNAGDHVIEANGQGIDNVQAYVSFNLGGQEIENLQLRTSASINGTGNALANIINGNSGNNIIDGLGGADTMSGAQGNDTYYVDNAGDHVIETIGQGTDNVQAYVSFNLSGQELENLQLRSAANINGTGNSIANIINGNSGNNIIDGLGSADTMSGAQGNDTYYVDNAGDHIVETIGQGTDNVQAYVSFNLSGQELENLQLRSAASINGTGNALANIINGNSGNNIIDGLGGADTMSGAQGNDTYYVDNAGDHVVETIGQGTDNVQAYVNFNLSGQELENLQLRSAASINGTGNSIANVIGGNSGNNVINGLGGNDTLSGAQGQDSFVFTTALDASTNVDHITDFSVADDTIQVDNLIFAALGGNGTLTADQFVANASGTAANTSQHIIYETDTGWLYYDSNGSTAGGSTHFATLAANLALTNADFVVV
ncbi:CAP domain-containing protein [Mesorhizobium newzealandense]|uniref:CAP domain-containing protein n=1 Tax=Mesorhizobium newzealandense TaxID=1300302 RepID=A0ABW4U891_9HYPH